MILNINTNSTIVFTNKLEKLRRSAIPAAVRGTLNKAAFDVKKNTLQSSSAQKFTNRQKTFFKAFSRVVPATGNSLSQMRSIVGMTETGLKGGNKNTAVKELEQQEAGGRIGNRELIPLNAIRSGKSNSKMVRPNARLENIRRKVDARKSKGNSPIAKLISSGIKAGLGGYVLAKIKTHEILWKVTSIRNKRPKLTAMYTFKKGRTVTVKARHFMEEAAMATAAKLEFFFEQEAKRQFKNIVK